MFGRSWTLTERSAAALIAAGAVLLGAALSNPSVTGLYHDDGIYIATAKSLAETGSYRLIDLPGAPLQTKYPPLYPALLALAWRAHPSFPWNLWLLKLVNAFLLGALVLLVHRWLSRASLLTPVVRLLAVAVMATAPGLLSWADLVLSDLTFLVLVLATMLADPAERPGSHLGTTTIAGALAAASALTRTLGLAVCLGLVWHVWFHRGWRDAAKMAAVEALLLLPWAVVVHSSAAAPNELLSYYTSYEMPAWQHLSSDPRLAGHIVVANLVFFTSALPVVLGLPWRPLAVVCLLLAGAAAAERHVRARCGLAGRIGAIYGVAILGHPYPMARYLVPLVPFAYALVLAGGGLLAGRLRSQRLEIVPAIVLLSVNSFWLAHFASVSGQMVHGEFGRSLPFEWAGYIETASWIRANTPPSAVLASADDTLYFLYSGRRCVRPWLHQPETYSGGYGLQPAPVDGEGLAADLAQLDVGWLIVDPLLGGGEGDHGRKSLRALLAAPSMGWRKVFESTDGAHVVYQRGRDEPRVTVTPRHSEAEGEGSRQSDDSTGPLMVGFKPCRSSRC